MTPEQLWEKIVKPGVTLSDFNKPMTPEREKEWAEKLAESRKRQKECLARKSTPFRNYRITI